METYLVRKRDTLWKIARENGVSVQAIAAANNLKGRQLHFLSIDQVLLIPDKVTETPDATITIDFRGLDFSQLTPKKLKLEYDGRVEELLMTENTPLTLCVNDHACGLKVWVQNLENEMEPTFTTDVTPIGDWRLHIDSRKAKVQGATQPSQGAQRSTAEDIKASTVHNAQVGRGKSSEQQSRVEQGKPLHALASLYTAANLRLPPANEKYRKYIVEAAGRHGLTPQSLAALINAEAAKDSKTGEWLERSNAADPSAAQGLAQFFEAAWTDVRKHEASLLHADCQKLSKRDFLAKRLVAKYAIDSAAAYAVLNLQNFSKATGMVVDSLAPEDKAKVAYVLHHEGLTGILRTLEICGEQRTPAQAEARLLGQLGKKNVEKVKRIIAQYDEDPVAAYKGWLFTYTDTRINVNMYVIDDAQKLATPPRSTADIFTKLGPGKPIAKPTPRPRPTLAKKPSTPPATNAATKVVAVSDHATSWHPPLKKCELRTAGLSATGARFGWTRRGGKRVHQGIDLIAVPGTPIFAVADGFVYKRAARSADEAYGNTLILVVDVNDLPEPQSSICAKVAPNRSHIGFFYAHLDEMIEGRGPIPVTAGSVIGKSGDSGNAKGMNTVGKGAHLHFEVRVDPLKVARGLSNRTDPLPFIEGHL